MKTRTEAAIKKELDQCIRTMKTLMMELAPADRLKFTHEVFLRLMPDRERPADASKKAAAQKKARARLTDEQQALIIQLGKKTDELFDIDGGDHRA